MAIEIEQAIAVEVVAEEDNEPTLRREALVSLLIERVKGAKEYHAKAFKQMRVDMDAVSKGYSGSNWDDERYVANILQRHVHQRTSALYSKNPTPVASRRKRMDHQVWDGDEETMKKALQGLAQASMQGMEPNAQQKAIVDDHARVKVENRQMDKVAECLEMLFKYFMDEQHPTFKSQMKALVRRVITTSVGFVKVGYQRDVDRLPDISSKMSDIQAQVDHLRRIADEAEKGDIEQDDAEIEELMLSLEALRKEPLAIIQEGLVFDFPECDSIIVDPMCRLLRGFVGASWVAHEMYLSTEEIKEIYDVDVQDSFLSYDMKGNETGVKAGQSSYNYFSHNADNVRDGLALVWEIYDKNAGLLYVVCDGYNDFLTEPEAPPIKLETFWPFFSLAFNEIEHKDQLYPPSDIKLLTPMQHEYNRARQGLREHRRANRPKYATPAGMLEQGDKDILKDPPANAVLELQALVAGQKVDDVLQPVKQIGIDPNLYEVKTIFDDVQLVVGQQEANFGQISKGTATETSIAESSRMSAIGANVDDLDSFMTEITRAAGQVLLLEMSKDEVMAICGPGAVWPEFKKEDVLNEVYLEIEAGSTGKPNKAAELQNIERIIPFLIQIPGIDPKFLGRELLKRLDDKMDLADAIVDKLPSIVAQNMMQGAKTQAQGRGGQPPEAQAGQGGNNAPQPKPSSGGQPPKIGMNA
tara:strand:- start:3857 stop:5947 length:2091 start_codon:yes stop_codon:yes gene_type:complete